MARRYIHYESAFEDYLRARRWPYVAVDEAKRALFADTQVKSFDFIVYRSQGPNWLVDIKGRKFPYDLSDSRRYWENWVTTEDLEDLLQWQQVFGDGFEARLIFAYWLTGDPAAWPPAPHHVYRSVHYSFLSIPVSVYQQSARPRSPLWQTVSMSAPAFRQSCSAVC